jgi:hypothetical protein
MPLFERPAPQSAQVIQLLTDPGKVLFPVIGRMQQQLAGGVRGRFVKRQRRCMSLRPLSTVRFCA